MSKNYTNDIKERLLKQSFISLLAEKLNDFRETLQLVLNPRFIPIPVALTIMIFIASFMYHMNSNPINSISHDLALFSALDIDVFDIVSENDTIEEDVYNADQIFLSELNENIEHDEILDEFQILDQLDEELISENNIHEYLELLDEAEMV